jgi:iron complex outermembrane receptor protein
LCLLLLNSYVFSEDLENFFDEVNNYTKKNNLNIEYQPSALTILYGKELEALGIENLNQALDFVPGLQTMPGTTNFTRISLRGNAQPTELFYEKIRFYINGIDINYNYFSNFPINLIERIEIIKGGNFNILGNNGYLGSINIVSKIDYDYNGISLGTGSFDKKNGSVYFNKKFNDWKLAVDSYYVKDNKKIDAPFGYTTFDESYSRDKNSLEGVEEKAFGINLKNDNWNFNTRYLETDQQNHYGFFGFIDFDDSGYSDYKVFTSQISYENNISRNNKLKAKLGVSSYDMNVNSFLNKLEPNTSGYYNPHYNIDYSKRDILGEISIVNNYFNNHEIEYGAYLSKNYYFKNNFYTNVDSNIKVGSVAQYNYRPTTDNLTLAYGQNSLANDDNNSYFIQDNYTYNENINFLVNTKVDDYESYKEAINYSLAGVYSRDNVNIYKAIFSKNHRFPSVFETNSSGYITIFDKKIIEPEESKTMELIYNYINQDEKFKINSYYTVFDNNIEQIFDGTNSYYINNKNTLDNYGLEVEYSKVFLNRSKLLLNSSYSIFKYKNDEISSVNINTPIASKITANLGYIYPLTSKLDISGTSKYYGTKTLINSDKIDDVILFDISSSYLIKKNLRFNTSIKNILDTNYYYYGYNSKNEKMLREGRTFNVSISYEF